MSPYYGLGTKEDIMNNLGVELNAVEGIKFVDYQRVRASGASADKYPGAYINDVSVDKERLLKDLVKNAFGVSIVCWVWASKDEDLATKMNEFLDEVKEKIMGDPTRDSNAYDTVIENVSTDGGSRHPQGQAIINLGIAFYSNK